jgi:predicted lipoprotein with Yx(FWY)xxD motif
MDRRGRRLSPPLSALLIAASAAALLVFAGRHAGVSPALAKQTPSIQLGQSQLGPVLTDDGGFTLYVRSADAQDIDGCVRMPDCMNTWPPLSPASATAPTAGTGVPGAIGTIQQPTQDGSLVTQVTYNGHPLYTYSLDASRGDINGVGLGGIWVPAIP